MALCQARNCTTGAQFKCGVCHYLFCSSCCFTQEHILSHPILPILQITENASPEHEYAYPVIGISEPAPIVGRENDESPEYAYPGVPSTNEGNHGSEYVYAVASSDSDKSKNELESICSINVEGGGERNISNASNKSSSTTSSGF